ncbi:MAG: hypothetical protein OEY93_02045 [Anaerolineae bacterium]|nr:hypothetical protein [Anaerolineae bacterium]
MTEHIPRHRSPLPLLMVWAAMLAACMPPPPPPTPTATTAPTLTATPTIVWFPPTSTPTRQVTVTPAPTEELRPGVGSLILADDFSNGEEWSLVETASTSAAVVNNHLTLVLNRANSFLYTTRRSPLLGDFYAEITAVPKLCAAGDEYGLMARVKDFQNYFRLTITCSGSVGVDRMLKGIFNPIIPKERVLFLPAGVPSEQRLGVWASGQEVRFFINGNFIYSIKDNVFGRGTLGVFVRTAGDAGVSADFRDLSIWEIRK